jgi:hypothetical protein
MRIPDGPILASIPEKTMSRTQIWLWIVLVLLGLTIAYFGIQARL